ncbi:MAG: sigma-70 family RNA polymerase sigma factor [Anaerolineaceae bacterium]
MKMSTEQREYIQKVLEFDPASLAEIYDLYSPAIYRYAMRMVNSEQTAEDCVSEVFTRFLQAIAKKKGPKDNIQAYLFRIAHNWIVDYYKLALPINSTELETIRDPQKNLPTQVEESFQNKMIYEGINQLTQDQREVIILRYFEGFDHSTIAKTVHKPVGAVKALQNRAFNHLRKLLENY